MIVSETPFNAKDRIVLQEQFTKALQHLMVLDTIDVITRDLGWNTADPLKFPNCVPADCVFDTVYGIRVLLVPTLVSDAELPLLVSVLQIVADPIKSVVHVIEKTTLVDMLVAAMLELSTAPYILPIEDIRIIEVERGMFYFYMTLPTSWPVAKQVERILVNG